MIPEIYSLLEIEVSAHSFHPNAPRPHPSVGLRDFASL